LVPFIYMFAALLKFSLAPAKAASLVEGRYSRTVLALAGASGLLTTVIAIVVAFFPASQIKSVLKYELSMFGLTLFFVALAAFFFFVYGRRKPRPDNVLVGAAVHVRPAERGSAT
jgi:membrane associated rhomboid family serine protease